MPSYTYKCQDGHVTERSMRMIDLADFVTCDWQVSPGKLCGLTARYNYMTASQARDAQPIAPVIVYKKDDGTYLYPGNSDARTYEGAQRVELRTLGEIRAVMKEQDRQDHEQWERRRHAEEEYFGPVRASRRAQLLASLETNFGKDLARLAAETYDARRAGRRYDPRNYFEVVEMDRSNREPQYDQRTGWRARNE